MGIVFGIELGTVARTVLITCTLSSGVRGRVEEGSEIRQNSA
jgi:hypothetical protein